MLKFIQKFKICWLIAIVILIGFNFTKEVLAIYVDSGTFTSYAIDTGQSSTYTTLDFSIVEPANTDLKFQLRTASTQGGLSAATWYGPTGAGDYYTTSGTAINSVHNNDRWIQYKGFFSTTDTSATPTLQSITINLHKGFIVNSTGFVGIGTSAPGSRLEVFQSSSETALTVTQSSTGNIVSLTGDSIATGTGLSLSADGLTTGTAMDITSTSAAGGASGISKLLNLSRSGTNTNASHTAYGLYSFVVNTGTTSTNIAGYFSASGATNNYGLIVENGDVGIGITTPGRNLDVLDATASTPQMRLTSDSDTYGEFYLDATGDLSIGLTDSSGGDDIILLDENLKICAGGSFGSVSCPAFSIDGTGNLIIEDELFVGGSTSNYIQANDEGIFYAGTAKPKRSIILTASGAITPSTAGAAQTKVDGTNHTYYVLDFDASSDEAVYWQWTMPDSYDDGTIDITYYWEASATSGDVVWCFQAKGIAANSAEDIDSALSSAVCETDTAQGNANDLAAVTESAATSNFAKGEYVTFKVFRDADNGADTMTGDARLVKIKIEYSTYAESDDFVLNMTTCNSLSGWHWYTTNSRSACWSKTLADSVTWNKGVGDDTDNPGAFTCSTGYTLQQRMEAASAGEWYKIVSSVNSRDITSSDNGSAGYAYISALAIADCVDGTRDLCTGDGCLGSSWSTINSSLRTWAAASAKSGLPYLSTDAGTTQTTNDYWDACDQSGTEDQTLGCSSGSNYFYLNRKACNDGDTNYSWGAACGDSNGGNWDTNARLLGGMSCGFQGGYGTSAIFNYRSFRVVVRP